MKNSLLPTAPTTGRRRQISFFLVVHAGPPSRPGRCGLLLLVTGAGGGYCLTTGRFSRFSRRRWPWRCFPHVQTAPAFSPHRKAAPRHRWFPLSHCATARCHRPTAAFSSLVVAVSPAYDLIDWLASSFTCSLSLTVLTPSTLPATATACSACAGCRRTRSGSRCLFGFHRNVRTFDGLIFHQRTFNFSRYRAVIHVTVNFFMELSILAPALSAALDALLSRLSSASAAYQNRTQYDSHQRVCKFGLFIDLFLLLGLSTPERRNPAATFTRPSR